MSGYVRTTLLLAAMTGLFLWIGQMLGGTGGAVIAFVIALAMNGVAYFNSDKIVLSMHGAKPAESSHPQLVAMVRDLARNAGLPMPKVYVMAQRQPNAFATGRNPENAAVAATQGLLDMLTIEEVAAVMAHELAHVKNHDTLIMTIAATIAGAISFLANFAMFFGGNRGNGGGVIGAIAVMIFAPMAAALIQMAISRSREYEADRIGAAICGHPLWLASALAKIDRAARGVDNRSAERHPASAHLFIINPLHAKASDNLFSTHPNTANRIAKLEALARGGGVAGSSPGGRAGAPVMPRSGGGRLV